MDSSFIFIIILGVICCGIALLDIFLNDKSFDEQYNEWLVKRYKKKHDRHNWSRKFWGDDPDKSDMDEYMS